MTTSVGDRELTRTELFIGGNYRPGATELSVEDPGRVGTIAGYAAAASTEQGADAVRTAHAAFPNWASLSVADRSALLLAGLDKVKERSEFIAKLLTRENGKVLFESRADVRSFLYRAELALSVADQIDDVNTLSSPTRHSTTRHIPLGVVTVIVPYNWPLSILAASLHAALLAGNTVVVKPPPTCPLATAHAVGLLAAALPPGVLNVVTGTDAEVGTPLIQNSLVKKVCFTGSVGGGKAIMKLASSSLTQVTLELGGNDPAIILDDADLSRDALVKLFNGCFRSAGQVCMNAKRLYVHRSRYVELVEGLSALTAETVVGYGLDEAATMGPLHTARQRDFVRELVDAAKADGTEVRVLGTFADGLDEHGGHYLLPSLILNPADNARVVVEEQFGPTIPIMTFDDDDDAVARANDTWSGLCSSVWSADIARAERIANQLRTGAVTLNDHGAAAVDNRAPFGGFNDSGFGRELGIEGMREFTGVRVVTVPE